MVIPVSTHTHTHTHSQLTEPDVEEEVCQQQQCDGGQQSGDPSQHTHTHTQSQLTEPDVEEEEVCQ